MTSMIVREDFSHAYDEAVVEVAIGSMPMMQVMWPEFFETRPMIGGQVTAASFGDFSAFNEKAEGVEMTPDAPVQQFKQTLVASVFAKKASISREMLSDQQWIGLEDFASLITLKAMELYETKAAQVLNNCTTTTYYTGEDALAICASTHTDPAGSTITGFDNLHALALNAANLKTVRTAHKKIPGYDADQIIVQNPSEIWVPLDLEDALLDILNSQRIPDSNNNNQNPFASGWTGHVWRYLTDTNRWFITDPLRRKMNARCHVSWPFELVFDENWKQLTRDMGAYCRFVFGIKDSRFISASEPS